MTRLRFDPFRDLERMTEQAFGQGRGSRVMPMVALRRGGQRRPIAAYDNYVDAERVVDHLSDNGFPVNCIAIIGSIWWTRSLTRICPT